MNTINDIGAINGEIKEELAGSTSMGNTNSEKRQVVVQEGHYRRFVCDMPENIDKMKLIIAAMDDWFKEQNISALSAKRAAVVEMAIDILYAKPEIEKTVGKERLKELMDQEAKKFV